MSGVTLPSASWTISGVITETRELVSQKNKDWRGYVVKVATLGSTFEIQVTREQFPQLHGGMYLVFNGRFEEQSGHQRFILERYDDPSAKASASAGKAVA